MSAPVISAIGHVAIRTPDLDACVDQATQVMGLTETARRGDGVFLTAGVTHHALHYIKADVPGADHVGLEARDAEALDVIRQRLIDADVAILSAPADAMFEDGFQFVAPGGFTFEVYVGMEKDPTPARPIQYATQAQPGVRPNRFGHVTLRVPDSTPLADFLQEILDFRISDAIAGGYFLRCNVDHHGLGVMVGPGELHHHAWEVQSIVDLGRLGDRVAEAGHHLLWGPVRHGVGNNIAAYFADPCGAVVEYYCDMQKIYNEATFEPLPWTEGWRTLWMQTTPPEFPTYGIPATARTSSIGAPAD
jgi:catechol 2,3-dioxygenase